MLEISIKKLICKIRILKSSKNCTKANSPIWIIKILSIIINWTIKEMNNKDSLSRVLNRKLISIKSFMINNKTRLTFRNEWMK